MLCTSNIFLGSKHEPGRSFSGRAITGLSSGWNPPKEFCFNRKVWKLGSIGSACRTSHLSCAFKENSSAWSKCFWITPILLTLNLCRLNLQSRPQNRCRKSRVIIRSSQTPKQNAPFKMYKSIVRSGVKILGFIVQFIKIAWIQIFMIFMPLGLCCLMRNRSRPSNPLPSALIHPALLPIQTHLRHASPTVSECTGSCFEAKILGYDSFDDNLENLTLQRAEAYHSANEIPNPHNWGCWVSDQANVLSRSAVEHINSVVDALHYDTGAEITLITVEALSNPNLSAKDFVQDIYNLWKMDRDSQGKALLILLVLSEEKIEIEMGWNMKHILEGSYFWEDNVGWLRSLLKRKVVPQLRKGKYDEGMIISVQSISEKVWEADGFPPAKPEREWWKRLKFVDIAWISMLIFLLGSNVAFRSSVGNALVVKDQVEMKQAEDATYGEGIANVRSIRARSKGKLLSFIRNKHFLYNENGTKLEDRYEHGGS